MFFLKGTRTVRIKKYIIHDRQCDNCNDFDLTLKVYRSYFHFWFIPIFATGFKTSKIRCNSCGAPIRIDSVQKEYESRTRTPFFLYTGVILVGLAILGGFGLSLWGSHERADHIAHPQPGDVYLIKSDEPIHDTYFFIRVIRVSGDSVIAYNNHVNYLGYTSKFDSEDYFVAEHEVVYTKGLLKEMLDKGFISATERGYDEAEGFNRIKRD